MGGAHPRLVGQVSTSRARRSMFAHESAAHRRGATCVHGIALGSPAAARIASVRTSGARVAYGALLKKQEQCRPLAVCLRGSDAMCIHGTALSRMHVI